MNALPIMVVVLCVLAIAYRYYSAFLAAKVAALDDSRTTPAHELNDGQNYHPTNKWVLFGHHFAAISGAGPLIGPVLAAQFGYAPGLIWLLVGVCLAGATQDFLILAASLRHKGKSLAQMARSEIGPVSGAASIAAILFIIVVALAGLGSAVVKALGGEEVDVPAKSKLVLSEKTSLDPEGHVNIPAESILYFPVGDAFSKPFQLSHAQKLISKDKDGNQTLDAQHLAAANKGDGVVFVNKAQLEIPGSSWGVFTIGTSIPIALLMGLWMYVLRKNSKHKIVEASVIGVVLMLACVQIGSYVPGTAFGELLNLSKGKVVIAMAIYGFVASVLPVWLLLCPRDYLSSYLKIGTIAALITGVLIVNPKLEMPAYVDWSKEGGGPNFPGQIFPFLFITIMCGAISGFHALVSSGTTPKMINKEGDARMIGYGAMLMEGLVGIVALIAACSLAPGDYYAIQVPMDRQTALIAKSEKLREINGHEDHLSVVEIEVGENLRGRKGGAVTLAVGMGKIFAGIKPLEKWIGYWYHFAIMFEALFILTTIDTGTRIGRFLVQEVMGKVNPQWGKADWWPSTVASTSIIVFGWGYMLWTGDIETIWPMFGIANQLLAVVAMCVATTILFNSGKQKYVPATLLPLAFIVSTTMTAGYQMLERFWSQAGWSDKPGKTASIDLILTALMLSCVVVVLLDSIRRWFNPMKPEISKAELAVWGIAIEQRLCRG